MVQGTWKKENLFSSFPLIIQERESCIIIEIISFDWK